MRVLLIDDEKELVTTLSERLDLRDVDNDWAISVEQGMGYVRERNYDWVVVDLKMPGLGGLDAIKAIKREQPLARIILLTGHSSTEELNEALRLGADKYLVKPVDIDVLLAYMQESKS